MCHATRAFWRFEIANWYAFATPMSRSFLILLLGVALGGAAGFWFGSAIARTGSGAPNPGLVDPPASSKVGAPGLRSPKLSSGAPTSETRPGPSTRRIPSASSGGCSLRGEVLSPEGSPIERVLIRIEPVFSSAPGTDEPPFRSAPPFVPTPEQLAAAERARAEEARTRRFEALTDERGQFRFENLPASRFDLSAWKEGYRIRGPSDALRIRAEAGDTVALVGEAVARVQLQVTGAVDPKPTRLGLRCERLDPARPVEFADSWLEEDPILELPLGKWKIRPVPPGSDAWNSPGVEVELNDPLALVACELRLEPTLAIYGSVTNPEERPGLAQYVAVLPEARWNATTPTMESGDYRSTRGDEYRHRVDAPGNFVVAALDGDRRVLLTRSITVSRGAERCDLVIPAPPRADELWLELVAEDGTLRPASECRLQSAPGPGAFAVDLAQASGRGLPSIFRLPAETQRLLTRSTMPLEVIAMSPGYPTASTFWTWTPEPVVRIALPSPAHLRIVIPALTTYLHAPPISLVIEQARQPKWSSVTLLPNARDPVTAESGPWRPEAVLLRWCLSGDSGVSFCLAEEHVNLVPGHQEHRFQLPELHALTLIRSDALRDRQLTLVQESRGGFSARQEHVWADSGRIEIRELPAGHYTIESSGLGQSGSIRVVIPRDRVVEVGEPRAWAIECLLPNTPKERPESAELASGDLILAYDGQSVLGQTSLEDLHAGFANQPHLDLELWRDGRVFPLRLSSRSVRDLEAQGLVLRLARRP